MKNAKKIREKRLKYQVKEQRYTYKIADIFTAAETLEETEDEGKVKATIPLTEVSLGQVILHYANIAQNENVEIFCIGTELSSATVSKPELWKELIKKVRLVYKGKLTYAANWYEEYDYIEFWDELDYAGLDPYFPLVASARPDKEELIAVWRDWVGMIEKWQKKIDKPVIFTEIGYKSSVGATDEPWQHAPIGQLDLKLQSDCYEALVEVFWDRPWLYGIYWWYWGVNPRMGGKFNRGFIPQNKPAQDIIQQWYKKPVPQKAY